MNSLIFRHFSVGRPRYVFVLTFLRKLCCALVESVDDLKTSQSIGGHRFPYFETLDAKIASTLKKITQNSYFKKRVNLGEQKVQP